MHDRLLVATRKGLFELRRGTAGQWAPVACHFLGEPVTAVLPDSRDGTLYAALNLGHFGVKLHRQRAGGSWEECPAPAYPPQPEGAAGAPWILLQVWTLEAGGADQPGVLWAGTIPGGLFRSADHGASWTLNRPLWDRPERGEWFGGGYDHPGIHSISVDPRDSRHLTLAVSCGGIWQTRDGGESWRCTAAGMYAPYMPPERTGDPNIQDVHRLVHCPAQPDVLWVQHHGGRYRSTDGGDSWQELAADRAADRPGGGESGGGSAFGFAVAVHPRDPNCAWFVPAAADACRVPPEGVLAVVRTLDGGQSFSAHREGLPPAPAYDLIYRHGLAVDDRGTRLALGSTTGGLWLSENGGEKWMCLSAHLPPIYGLRFAA